VISTELTIGMFALSGVAFLLCLLEKGPDTKTSVAHWALIGGLAATPFAIITGVQAAPGEGIDNPLLANKLLLSMAATGLAIGLGIRWFTGAEINRIHSSIGMVTVGMILITAGMGGEFSRGETLLFFLPKDLVILFPIWASIVIMLCGLAMIGKSAIHRG
jgi:hypothetical protein